MFLSFITRSSLIAYKKYLEKKEGLSEIKEILNIILDESSTEEAVTQAIDRLQALAESKEKETIQEKLEALFLLGVCYLSAIKVAPDPKFAVELFTIAATHDHAPSQNQLGACFDQGIATEKDPIRSAKFYILSAKQGYAQAQSNLGRCYLDGHNVIEDTKRAVELSTLAANQGEVHAQYNLGSYYHLGIGVEKDQKHAFELFTLAAEQGHATSLYNLGVFYDKGIGIIQDPKRAVEFYTLAASKGIVQALDNLGLCYQDSGFRRNSRRAVLLFQTAAKKGFNDSNTTLAQILTAASTIGLYFPPLEEAVSYYNSIKHEDPSAFSTLAFCYQMGLGGVPQDIEKALELYLTLSKGHACHWDLYMCYRMQQQKGSNSKSLSEFYEALDSDRQQGNVEANLFFGYLHEYGAPGLPKHSLQTAHRCYDAILDAEYNSLSKGDGDLKQLFENTRIEFEIDPSDVSDYVYNKLGYFENLSDLKKAIHEIFPISGIAQIIADYTFAEYAFDGQKKPTMKK